MLLDGQEFCSALMAEGPYRSLTNALVCGVPLPSGEHRQVFLDVGLIHLLVVSGAHLIFLDRMIPRRFSGLRLVVILLYMWLTGFGAPVVRAGLRVLIDRLLRGERFTALQREVLIVVMICGFVPEWLWSRSYLMSWLCALALALPSPFPRLPNFSLSLKCYVLLFPFCMSSPFTVLINTLLAPVIAFILFPLNLAALIFPGLTVFTDLIWRSLLLMLSYLPEATPPDVYLSTEALMITPWLLHLILLIGEVLWLRRRSFYCS